MKQCFTSSRLHNNFTSIVCASQIWVLPIIHSSQWWVKALKRWVSSKESCKLLPHSEKKSWIHPHSPLQIGLSKNGMPGILPFSRMSENKCLFAFLLLVECYFLWFDAFKFEFFGRRFRSWLGAYGACVKYSNLVGRVHKSAGCGKQGHVFCFAKLIWEEGFVQKGCFSGLSAKKLDCIYK